MGEVCGISATMAFCPVSSFHCNRLALHGRPSCSCSLLSTFSSISLAYTIAAPLRPLNGSHRNIRLQARHSDGIGGKESGNVEYVLLTSMRTMYNDITILEAPESMDSPYAGSRILLLDSSYNIHSIYRREKKWTGSYWDEFATLPAIIPDGPVAILGLGGGTAAHLMLDLWPSLKLKGWEIDEILVDKARAYLSLSELEKQTAEGGCLQIHIGDALSPSATVSGGFAGIVVDLFDDGKVIPQLQQVETWLELKKRLAEGGRIMVNCGGTCVERRDLKGEIENGTWTWEDGGAIKDATISAISKAFPTQMLLVNKLVCLLIMRSILLSLRKMDSGGGNYLALTGPFPNLQVWAAAVPEHLRSGVQSWRCL